MAEMVASRSMQMLDYLADKDEERYRLVRDEVKELVSMLQKMEDLFSKSRKVQEDMKEMRNLGYTIEDVLEYLAVQVEVEYMPSKKRCTTSLVNRFFDRQNDVATSEKVARFRRHFTRLKARFHDTFCEGVLEIEHDPVEEPRVENDGGVALPRQMEDNFVRTEDLDKLIPLVKENRVVSIWGVKGLGKTTLARNVYTHKAVKTRYETEAWVSVGQDHQAGSLSQNMLNQLGAGAVNMSVDKEKGAEDSQTSKHLPSIGAEKRKGAENSKFFSKFLPSILWPVKNRKDEKRKGAGKSKFTRFLPSILWPVKNIKEAEEIKTDKLTPKTEESSHERNINELMEILRRNKCFIVVDGISETSEWKDISCAFLSIENTETRILLTTEVENIEGAVFHYQLRPLTEQQGWELLQKHIFRGEEASDFGLRPKLGKQMVQQCGGLPLAISSLGRTLCKLPSLSEWHKVNDDVAGYLHLEAHQTQPSEDSDGFMVPNYNHLSYFQKQCFLYLAMFKENEDVDSQDLKLLWMAEGMISPQQQPKMDEAEHYVQELVDKLSAKGRFKPLRLHKHARELSLHQGEREDVRLKVLDFSDGKQLVFDHDTFFEQTRRLAIHFNKLSSPSGDDHLYATPFVRSLFFLNSDQEYVYSPVKIPDFSEFIRLRVLHFVRCKFEDRKLPQGIDKLFNLRYLGVLYCDLEGLPSSITNVRNLHTLNVRACDDAKITIPDAVSQMVRLKHLRLPNNSALKLDDLLDLETLDGFNADTHDIQSLSKLEKLRHVVVHAYSNDSLKSIIEFLKSHGDRVRTNLLIKKKCDFTSQKGLLYLEEFLMCPNLDALTLSMMLIRKFPNCGKLASKHLTQMKLIGCKLTEDPMQALGKFPNLQNLCLSYGAFVETKIAISDGGFPNLEYLEFCCLPNLEEWNVDKGAIQKLSTLIVSKCPVLKGIPDGLASLTSLKNMEIDLPPTALSEAQYKIYKEKFGFVTSLSIREFDPLSAATSSDH